MKYVLTDTIFIYMFMLFLLTICHYLDTQPTTLRLGTLSECEGPMEKARPKVAKRSGL